MGKTVRIGLIGAGGNTRYRHIPGFKAVPGVELVAVCNRTPASGEKVAREFGIGRVAESWRAIVEAPDIDAVCIGTWPNLHGKLAVAALRAGKHVLTEARMARNLAEAEMMLAESKLHPNLVAQIVPAPMSLPFDATVADLLAGGELGTLREVHLTATTDGVADSAQPLSWRQDLTLSGKNTLHLGIYYEMILRWLGRGVTSLVADAAIFTKERRDEDGVPQTTTIPESLTVLGAYADGARLVAHFSGVERAAPRSEIRLNGSKAGLRLDLAKGELGLTAAGQPEKLVSIAPEKRGAWRVEADFIDSIREGKPVTLTDFATGVRYMQFTEAVWESWNAGGARVTI
ncbi:MAG: Gfo/Idh/MocA family oxidoreductase [Opitutaceae bacterium]|nr:Gfo/Idh/MocA family oxidoreductase [Opitutaceae bacterium]